MLRIKNLNWLTLEVDLRKSEVWFVKGYYCDFGVEGYGVGVSKYLWNFGDEILLRWVGCDVPDPKLKEK